MENSRAGNDNHPTPTGRMNLFELERTALRDLVTLVEARSAADTAAKASYQAATSGAEKELSRARKHFISNRERELTTLTDTYKQSLQVIAERHKSESEIAENEYNIDKQRLTEECDIAEQQAKAALNDARWTADSIYEAAEKRANDDRDQMRRSAAATEDRIEALWRDAGPFFAKANISRETLIPDTGPGWEVVVDPQKSIDDGLHKSESLLERLKNLRTLKLSGLTGFLLILVPLAALSSIPTLFVESKVPAILIGSLSAAALSLLLHWLLRRAAFTQTSNLGNELSESLGKTRAAKETLIRRTETDYKRRLDEAAAIRDRSKRQGEDTCRPIVEKLTARRKDEMKALSDRFAEERERVRRWRQETTDQTEEVFQRERGECEDRYNRLVGEAERDHADRFKEAKDARASSERIIAFEWRDGQDRVGRSLNKLRANGLEHFPDWSSPFWYNPPAAIRVPTGVRFGDFEVDLSRLPGGIPAEDDPDAPSFPVRLTLPAFLPFPDRCSLLLKAKDQGRQRAVQALQAIMLRLLTAIPPGKLRFTIIDPVGLGENFAAFMHLTDYDEQLVGARIWTEPAQIEKRLADITAHMETVIQKYLRNQYKTIEEYNQHAGEVAEPFRVLVIANFPANFTLESCRRLVSIINSGPSCGVYTLITYDPKQPLPQGFNLADIEQGSINLVWKENQFVWKDSEFSRFPLELETPPSLDEMTRLVRLVGERSKNANRVEVPFEYVAPRQFEVWASDSRHGLSVAIGRAGATKRQMFELGKGTAQHALIAGKTGSGKSTLLHALITNLAMSYSPDEVELYLIDFKKGVEFKSYAAHRLPHARAIAIESEREFGLSVLQRLDAELKVRGDLFRAVGVNSIAEYRDHLDKKNPPPKKEDNAETQLIGSKPSHPGCPRIMLVVDEFQEFFIEDDRISQECAMLLDRLVRQGRAFGLHVLLGSQTLGGAYSLARSTIDQMAVRIALQCSDADAQLILSKDNTAARLLSRPGEAIYNNQNGLVEGNDLFQIVWLDDDKKEKVLADIRKRADTTGRAYAEPLVFEGNIPAVIETNVALKKLLDAPTWPESVRAGSAWLGDAIAIKDPTAAVFRPVGGQNLLMVGQHDEAALSIVASSLISFAAQFPPKGVRIFVLDGTPDDDPHAGYLTRVANSLPDHEIRILDRTNMAEALAAVGTEVNARQKGESKDKTPCYFFIVGAQRFRELRKEDDFGFGRRGAEKVVSAAEHLQTIAREGPPVHVFSILWADTPTNLGRVVDRAGMREYGLRILFQMSANDSSALIDSPAASRLGRNRALFVTEESPQPEKFRPYGMPGKEFLTSVKNRLEDKALPSEPEAEAK
jgi:S-DNA-T family DNA segregation ATPase FtsK/SpoIIIE